MFIKYITPVIRKMFQKKISNPVGRWRIEICNTKMSHKVDLSNEDHCGPCGQYALTKIEKIEIEKEKEKEIEKIIKKK